MSGALQGLSNLNGKPSRCKVFMPVFVSDPTNHRQYQLSAAYSGRRSYSISDDTALRANMGDGTHLGSLRIFKSLRIPDLPWKNSM